MTDRGTGWGAHIRATLVLGLPLIGSQLATVGFGVTDTIMLGWLGAESLAAGVLGTQLFFFFFLTGAGIAHAVAPIVAEAMGADNPVAVRRSVRMGLWASTIYGVIAIPFLLNGGAILGVLGQAPELTVLADDYLDIAAYALLLTLWHNVLRSYFSSLDRAGIVLWATLAGLVLNVALNWAFIFGNWGAPALGIQGAAVATLGTNFLVTLFMLVYALREPILRQYEIFVRFWRPDWGALAEVVRLGWPISLTLLAEVSLFSFSSIMMGWLGTIQLAAHGIALQVISVIFMIPLGLAFAATVRIGQAHGRKDGEALRRAAVVVLVMTVILALVAGVLLVVIPDLLIALFLDSEASQAEAAQILAYGVPLLAVAAIFQVVDSVQVVACGLLRGIKDTRVPMWIAVVSYLGFGIAAAYWLGFVLDWGGVGIWSGLAVGLTLAAILLLWRFRTLTSTL